MKLRSQKQMRSSENYVSRDRLSEMPDEVIVHILSCMPTLDAVRTVLLRRFGNLWTLVHTLRFDMPEFLNNFYLDGQWDIGDVERFYIFVRNVLIFHKRLSIHKFHLCVEFSYWEESITAADDIKTWLKFALDRQAKEISFFDRSANFYTSSSIFPNLTSQSLVTLVLDFCEIKDQLRVNLGSLKKLLLNHVFMCDEEFQRFISRCPSLQELVILNPSWMKKLSFTAPNIHKLSLVLTDDYQCENPLSLNCPNLKALNLEIDYRLDIIDISSVRDIYIKKNLYATNDDDKLTLDKMLYGKFGGTEVIHLSVNASGQFLHTIQHLHLLENRWKRVVLELQGLCQDYLSGIYQLMSSLRHLEELIIYTTKDFKGSTDLLPLELFSPYVTPQLKTITLHGYGESWKSQLQLVEFLLKSAAVLDKLVIVPIEHRLEEAKELEFVKRVSSFPRASTNARVHFA